MPKVHCIIPSLSKQDILRFWFHVRIRGIDECWEWRASKSNNGYGYFVLRLEGSGFWKTFRAHRVVWTIANGPVPSGLLVCHHCDCPSCQNPHHLFIGNHVDNMHDRDHKNRQACGERQGNARYTEQEIRNIRSRYAAGGISQYALARAYGMDQSTVSSVVRRKLWAHVI